MAITRNFVHREHLPSVYFLQEYAATGTIPTSAAGRADWVAILRAVMPYVDVFLPNIEETLFTLRRETFEEFFRAAGGPGFLPLVTPALLSDLSQQVLEMGAKVVGFKLGHRGLYLRTCSRSAIEAVGEACASRPSACSSSSDR